MISKHGGHSMSMGVGISLQAQRRIDGAEGPGRDTPHHISGKRRRYVGCVLAVCLYDCIDR